MTSYGELGNKENKQGKSFGRHGNDYETDFRGTPYFEEVETINKILENSHAVQVPLEVKSVLGYIERTAEAGDYINPQVIRCLRGRKKLGDGVVRAYEKLMEEYGMDIDDGVVRAIKGVR